MSEETKMQIENAINAIGAVCEIAGFLRKEMINQGFPETEAFLVCKSYVLDALCQNRSHEND